ncbi:uncharacterized protein LOC122254341 [Penaeus japonicus]|uniref:uncharacterized protein LOC122254341 n=1 Tax=Penaeus japonicus TaxID=27405 RepID=UPI001C710F49|nr:uncharacterized protein LOC122254341 [Penaeus japonicus]XP_042873929.1 uncharacterized protein LOC122254341 [Penaeus japonicus]
MMYPRPSSSCSSAPAAAAALAALMLIFLASPPAAHAKRFDCQMFCRRTGFSGMVGGCRCSFTLFTAKRAVRDHNSVPGEADSYYEAAEMPEGSLTDFLRMARETHETFSREDTLGDASSSSSSSSSIPSSSSFSAVEPSASKILGGDVPKNHPVRLLVRSTAPPRALARDASVSSSSSFSVNANRLSRSPAPQLLIKRKEFEQDLDNGDTNDYLRLPY